MVTAFVVLMLVVLGTLSLVGVLVLGLLKLAFKLVALALGGVLVMAGGATALAVGVGIGIALLAPLVPLLLLIWLIARATRPAPTPALVYAPRH